MNGRAIAALAASVCLIWSCASPPAPEQPVQEAPPPHAAVPATGAIAEAFGGYLQFQRDAALISGGFLKPEDVDAALDRLATYNATELSRGFVAYTALVAANNPGFAQEARRVARSFGEREAIAAFTSNPAYASSLKGADGARTLALYAARLDGARLDTLGSEVRAEAGRLRDRGGWGAARVRTTREARLARIRATFAEATPFALPDWAPPPSSLTVFAWNGETPAPASLPTGEVLASPPDQAGVLEAVLSVGALHAIGATQSLPRETLDPLLAQRDLVNCFERARLQLVQCVSAGEFLYENAACIGEAGLQTRGLCLSQIAKAR